MSTAKEGDTVKVHYIGTLEDGTRFDSSEGREPLEFTIGSGQVISGFDDAARGMAVGDVKTVTIPSGEAYGARDESQVQTIERSLIPPHVELEVGTQLRASAPNGQTMMLTVVDLDDSNVTIDANHPLAGKDLTFAIELVGIS